MTALLLDISLLLTAVVVLALVVYLIGIIIALAQAQASLARLAKGLVAVRDHTRPLPHHMQAINHDLSTLLQGLLAVNANLAAIVDVAKAVKSGNDKTAGAA